MTPANKVRRRCLDLDVDVDAAGRAEVDGSGVDGEWSGVDGTAEVDGASSRAVSTGSVDGAEGTAEVDVGGNLVETTPESISANISSSEKFKKGKISINT